MKHLVTRITAAFVLLALWVGVFSIQFGIEQLVTILSQMNSVLPVPTRLVLSLADGGIYLGLGIFTSILVLVVEATAKTPSMRMLWQVTLLIFWLLLLSATYVAMGLPMIKVSNSADLGAEVRRDNMDSTESSGYSACSLLMYAKGVPGTAPLSSFVTTFQGADFHRFVESEFMTIWGEMDNSEEPTSVPGPNAYRFKVQGDIIKVYGYSRDEKIAIMTANAAAKAAETYSELLAIKKSQEAISWLEDVENKEMDKLTELDQKITNLRSEKAEAEELRSLLISRSNQEAVVNSLRSLIQEEASRVDSEQPVFKLLEFAQTAQKKQIEK